MSVPEVVITESDGQLGSLPSGQLPLAILGCADSGTVDTPAGYGRTASVVATFGAGPLVEAACYHITTTGRPVIAVRSGNTNTGTHTNIDVTGVTGTSVATVDSGDSSANDDYEPYLKVITGGTIGVSGIVIKWSLDGGRTLSANTALGTANTFAFPGSGGIGYDFAAGTLVAGDIIQSRTGAPNWNATELGTALTALKNSAIQWELCEIVGPIDATAFDALTTAFAGMPEKAWIGHVRKPTVGESEAAYLTSVSGVFASKATTQGMLTAHWAKTTSGLTYRSYHRPPSYRFASQLATVTEEVDIADIDLGASPGVTLVDANGNPQDHDELVSPGLDDARFAVYRTHDTAQGAYCNNPRLFSATGSDFEFMQHRRVMGIARKALRFYFTRRLSKPIVVDSKTGYILESQAVEIETGADALLRGILLAKPKASGPGLTGSDGKKRFVVLSRTDNILSTKTLTVQAGIIPLAYPKAITIDLGFRNPALQIRTV